jgi:hypothetical protein
MEQASARPLGHPGFVSFMQAIDLHEFSRA